MVECHSGYDYADRPVALHWQGARLEITCILARWRSPAGNDFRVQTEDGQAFSLVYLQASDEWQILQH